MTPEVQKAIEEFDLPNPFCPRTVVDFVICCGKDGLTKALHGINCSGSVFLTATQSGEWYTVFFWRHLT